MSQFLGMCVGGPLAGKYIAQSAQKFAVYMYPAFGKTEHWYNWLSLGPNALWIHESLNRDEAIREMILAYERDQASKRKGTTQGGQAR